MLKSKGRNRLLLVLCIFSSFFANAQKDLVISGGNTVSSFVCANKTAFVWGSNAAGQLGLHDAGGALITTDPITTPTAITKFSGIASVPDVKQINSGSGSHFVALACAGDVWAWGVNGSGQIGTGSAGGVVTIPTRVIANAAVAATNRQSGTNYLINAAVVYSGTVNSFAILSDGKLVSWGANSNSSATNQQAGQLGQGTTTDAYTANYVLTAPGTPLTGVTQIFAGDNVAYALVDPDGDGIGTVYSWGNGLNGTLGRNATGTGNPISGATVQDSYARPVYYADGTQMNNIAQLQAGDVFGIALDVNGYVWTWGNGGWNNSTGNTTVNYTGSDPRKVIAGNTTGASNDGTYLLAKAIGGGQGYGMAVSIDGKPVSWGGNGSDCTAGGMTGTGTTNGTAGIKPSYIQYGPGLVHNNVTLINRGDTWGFYGTADNDLYAWGCNTMGQLGIGSVANQAYATQITPPTGCDFRDPPPTANITSGNTNVCPTFSLVLNSGFVPNTGLGASYMVTWYKTSIAPANIVQQGKANVAANLTYTATAIDKYIVVVSYIGTNSGCSVFPDAIDEVTLTEILPPYTANPGTYCSGNATFAVTGTGAYDWYAAQTGGTKLNPTTTNSFTTAISNAEVVDATHIRLWVNDVSSYLGYAVPTAPCATPTDHQTPNRTYQKFTITTAGLFESVQIKLYNGSNISGNANFIPKIYADNAGAVGAIVFTGASTAIAVPANNTYGGAKTVPINYNIAPGTYWLMIDQGSSPTTEVGYMNCFSYPATDNSGKAALTITGGRHDGNPDTNSGTAFNWKISNNYYPCGRVPVVLSKVCPPCSKPTAVVITAPATTPKDLCIGTGQTLSGTATVTAAAQNTNFTYSWIKSPSTVLTAPTVFTPTIGTPSAVGSNTTAIPGAAVTESGTYILRVEDGNTGNSSCYTEASVVINVNPIPTITGTLTVCVGSTTQLTGSGTAATTTPWVSATPAVATISNTGLVTGVSAGTSIITYTDNKGCSKTATVTVNALPTITGTLTACVGLTTQLTGSATAGTAPAWVSATPTVATVDNTGLVTGVSAGTSLITYTNSNGCKITATVTINALPTITGTLNVCVGLTTQLTGSATAGTAPAWVSATPAVATVDNTGLVTAVSAGTSVITYTNSNGCKITATVTVNALPTITGTLTACINATTQLTGSGTAAATTPWVSATPAVATVSNTGLVTGVSAGTSVITYTNSNGCKITATVTINALPTITGTLTACVGSTTQLTGSATAGTAPAWASATPAVATVDNTGLVTGVSAGTSIITYTNSNGCKITATVTINALPTITGTLTVCIGSTTQLTGSATAGTAPAWVSATPVVATVDNTGLVSGVTAGTSVITYTNSNGCKITATVTVSAVPTITGTLSVCIGSTTTLTGSGTPATINPWVSASTAVATVSNTGVVTGVTGGTSVITYTTSAGCKTTATVTVNTTAPAGVTITTVPGSTICAGDNVTFTAAGSNGGLTPTYEWTSPPSLAVLSTTNTYSSSSLTNGQVINVKFTSSLGCAVPAIANASVTMTVNPIPTPSVSITVNDADQTICPGTSITFTAAPTQGGTPPGYVWKKNGGVISGETNATYTTTGAANGDIYTVEMLSSLVCAPTTPAASNPITITVTPVPTISVTITADKTSICANNPVQYTAVVSGTGSTPAPTYEWFVTSSATTVPAGVSQGTPSTTATTFTTSALTAANNKVYVQVVSNATCAATTAVASNVVSVVVNSGITAGSISADQTICYNTVPAALIQTTASDAASPGYTWEASLTGLAGSYNPVPGTGNGYTFPAVNLTQDVYIHRIVTDASAPAPCNVATSNVIHITVRPQLVAGVISADESICSGAVPAIMSQTTAPTGGTGTFTYQWQSDASGSFQDISGATNSSYTSPALTATTQFQRKEISGGSCGSVISNIVTKTITAKEIVTASINDPGQVCDGSAAFNFVATASTTGTGTLSYQWYLGPVSPSNAVGTNSPNYTYNPVIGDDNKAVQVVVTTSNGCNAGPGNSNIVTLDIVGATTPTVNITVDHNPNCAGIPTKFTATSTGGGISPTYQWYLIPFGSATPQAVGTGGTTYTSSSLADGDQVYVELTSSLGCLIGTNPFTSNKITMQIKPIPAPSIAEGDQTICAPIPGSFTFHGNVTAGNTYDWKLNNVSTGITTPDITASQSGTYTLNEDNGVCNSTSQPVVLTVIQTPVANAGADMYLKEGDIGNLNGSGGAVYSWSPSTDLSSSTVSNPSFPATSTITYTLTVSDPTNTCSSTDQVTVFVVKPVEVPNVITVNGDGNNDDWEIKNIEGYPNCIIEIYNRWGNLVWKTQGYPKNWDGTNFRNGQVLPDGTYFYIINLQSQIYDEPLTGWVQIIK